MFMQNIEQLIIDPILIANLQSELESRMGKHREKSMEPLDEVLLVDTRFLGIIWELKQYGAETGSQ